VGLVVVVVVVERLVHNRLERKRVHRNLDKGQRKLLVISFLNENKINAIKLLTSTKTSWQINRTIDQHTH
jgi:hypothetical protein